MRFKPVAKLFAFSVLLFGVQACRTTATKSGVKEDDAPMPDTSVGDAAEAGAGIAGCTDKVSPKLKAFIQSQAANGIAAKNQAKNWTMVGCADADPTHCFNDDSKWKTSE